MGKGGIEVTSNGLSISLSMEAHQAFRSLAELTTGLRAADTVAATWKESTLRNLRGVQDSLSQLSKFVNSEDNKGFISPLGAGAKYKETTQANQNVMEQLNAHIVGATNSTINAIKNLNEEQKRAADSAGGLGKAVADSAKHGANAADDLAAKLVNLAAKFGGPIGVGMAVDEVVDLSTALDPVAMKLYGTADAAEKFRHRMNELRSSTNAETADMVILAKTFGALGITAESTQKKIFEFAIGMSRSLDASSDTVGNLLGSLVKAKDMTESELPKFMSAITQMVTSNRGIGTAQDSVDFISSLTSEINAVKRRTSAMARERGADAQEADTIGRMRGQQSALQTDLMRRMFAESGISSDNATAIARSVGTISDENIRGLSVTAGLSGASAQNLIQAKAGGDVSEIVKALAEASKNVMASGGVNSQLFTNRAFQEMFRGAGVQDIERLFRYMSQEDFGKKFEEASKEMKEAYERGAKFQNLMNEYNKTLKALWEQAKTTFMDMTMFVGEFFLPILEKALTSLQWIRKELQEHPAVFTAVKTAAKALMVVLSIESAGAFFRVLRLGLGGIFGDFELTRGIATKVLNLFKLMPGPISQTALAIASCIKGGNLLSTVWVSVVSGVGNVAAAIRGVALLMAGLVGWPALIAAAIVVTIGGAVVLFRDKISDTFQFLTKSMVDFWNKAVGMFGALANVIAHPFKSAADWMNDNERRGKSQVLLERRAAAASTNTREAFHRAAVKENIQEGDTNFVMAFGEKVRPETARRLEDQLKKRIASIEKKLHTRMDRMQRSGPGMFDEYKIDEQASAAWAKQKGDSMQGSVEGAVNRLKEDFGLNSAATEASRQAALQKEQNDLTKEIAKNTAATADNTDPYRKIQEEQRNVAPEQMRTILKAEARNMLDKLGLHPSEAALDAYMDRSIGPRQNTRTAAANKDPHALVHTANNSPKKLDVFAPPKQSSVKPEVNLFRDTSQQSSQDKNYKKIEPKVSQASQEDKNVKADPHPLSKKATTLFVGSGKVDTSTIMDQKVESPVNNTVGERKKIAEKPTIDTTGKSILDALKNVQSSAISNALELTEPPQASAKDSSSKEVVEAIGKMEASVVAQLINIQRGSFAHKAAVGQTERNSHWKS